MSTGLDSWLDGHTWGDGAYWGEDTAAGKLWSFTLKVNAPHYRSMHAGHTGDHDRKAGGDGTYLKAGKLTGRHHLGALSTDTSATMDSTGTWKYSRHNANVKAAILPDNGSGGTAFDAFGSPVQPATHHRLHQISPQAGNLIYNPTFADNYVGWTQGVWSGGATASYSTQPGDFAFGIASGSSGIIYQEQTIAVNPGAVMSFAAFLAAFTVSGTSGWFVDMFVRGATTNTVYFSQVLSGDASGTYGGTFTVSASDSALQIFWRINNGSSGGQVNGNFGRVQLEYGQAPTPYVDHFATRHVHTHLFPWSAGTLDPVNGTPTKISFPMPALGAVWADLVVSGADTSEPISLVIGTLSNGYELQWATNGNLFVNRIVGGVVTAATSSGWGKHAPLVNSIIGANVTRDANSHVLRLAVDNGAFASIVLSTTAWTGIEASFDGYYVMSPATDAGGPFNSSGGVSYNVPVLARPSNGSATYFNAGPRQLYLAGTIPFQRAASSFV